MSDDTITTIISHRLERLENKLDALNLNGFIATVTERMNTVCERIERLEQRPARIVATSAAIGAIIGAATTLLLFVYQLVQTH